VSANPRIVLVHDWLNQSGGAERVLEHLVGMFPGAPVHTSIYWREGMPEAYRDWDIRTMWMDRLPGIYRHHQHYFPLYAAAFGGLDLSGSGADLVISNKSGFCHATRTGSIPHLCYCLAPTRYVWQFESYAARERLPGVVRALLRPLISALRRWDWRMAQRESLTFVAISTEVQARIRAFYGREAEIVYPPVDLTRFASVGTGEVEDYFLVVSRLIPYKRIDLAVRACTELGLPLVVAGDGRDRAALEAMAGPTVRFLGRVSEAELTRLMARCRALLFPGLEDFGLTPVEAQASGRPAIAYRGGGALDSVVAGETGLFFDEATVPSLSGVLSRFDGMTFDPAVCRANAARFGSDRFEMELLRQVDLVTGGCWGSD